MSQQRRGMGQKSIPGNHDLGKAIKERRIELKLTIEEAANRAGVGTKTWCRYEAGESIRQDKAKGICKALNWRVLPSFEEHNDASFDINEYRVNKYWSKALEDRFGATAAASFVIGSEFLEDHINEDLEALSHMPKGSHVGQLGISFLADDLPPQFLTRYDYEFMYALRCALCKMKECVTHGKELIAHSVIEELVLYLVIEESRILLEDGDYTPEEGWDDWAFDLFDDMDIVTLLYSDMYLSRDNTYYFDRWTEYQFYMD